MSRGRKIIALIIMLAFIAIGVAFMIQRIGAIIGWDQAADGWWIIALLAGLILLTAFLVYRAVSRKLNR